VKHHRVWLSLIGFCFLAVLGGALAFSILIGGVSLAFSSHAAASDETQNPPSSPNAKFTGMITDSFCAARHMRNSRQTATDCVLACVGKGATYVLVDGDHTYTLIGDEQTLANFAGERASVTGNRQGDTIIVVSVTPTL
jgi:hypothetical protein